MEALRRRMILHSIGAQIWLAIGTALAGLLGVIGAGVLGLHEIERNMAELVNVSTVKSDAVAQMHLAIVARVDAMRNIALTPEINAMQADLKRVEALGKTYAERRATLRSLGLAPAEAAALDKADAAERDSAGLNKAALQFARSMQPELAAETLTTRLAPLQAAWTRALDELADATEAGRAAVLAEAQAARQRTLVWMCACGLLALAISGAIATTLVRRISLRLGSARTITRHIADGDLTSTVDAAGHDAIAQTLASLHSMQERLRAMIGDVRGAALQIQTASGEIASGTNDLSARTERSAGNLQQTAASMEQLTSTVKSAADSAAAASDLAVSASTVAQRGGSVVSQVVATMDEINDSSRRIAEITGVIDGIAFQTNILALNAAVEAARAGEQGRGFAVVAAEVRLLAQRSAEAAKQIKILIDSSVAKVEAGTRLVGEAGTTMDDIVASVRRVGTVIGEISRAASEQTAGIDQINAAVAELDTMTQQNAALVEQSAAAAESMREQSGRLAQVVGAFRLETEGPPAA